MKSFATWLNESHAGSWSWFSANALLVAKLKKSPFSGRMLDKTIVKELLKSFRKDDAWNKDESWKLPSQGSLYRKWTRADWKAQIRKWAKVHDADEWIAYVSALETSPAVEFWWRKAEYVTASFEGSSGVWSCKVSGMKRNPKEADLLLKIMEIKNDEGWMQTSCSIGRETFVGFMKKWRKEVQPLEWIAFARVENLGSIRYIEKRDGIKPKRPDLDVVEIWFRPSKSRTEAILMDSE